jgi:hypothetical protein
MKKADRAEGHRDWWPESSALTEILTTKYQVSSGDVVQNPGNSTRFFEARGSLWPKP